MQHCKPQPRSAPGHQSPGPTYIHVVACPHVVGDDELGGKLRHEAGRPVFSHHKNVLFGVRGEPGKIFNFLLGSQASRGVCGQRRAECRQPPGPQRPSRPPEPTGVSTTVATGRPCRDRAGGGDGTAGGDEAGARWGLPQRDKAPGRDSPLRYSRKRKSSPGKLPPAILQPGPGVSAAAAPPKGSAPEKRKKE